MSQRVTVIIPNYNSERFLEKTLASLLRQTYTDFNTILLDDGSTDGSVSIAERFIEKLPKLKILKLENVGITANWNRALKYVKTEFFSFLHCDDEYHPSYLEEMVQLMDQYPDSAIAHCPAQTIDENSQPMVSPIEVYKKNRYFNASKFSQPADIDFKLLISGSYINCPSVFYRTEMIQQVGLFNEQFAQVQDWEYWFRVLLSGYRICATRQDLFFYRRHSSNMTVANTASFRRYKEELELLQWAHEQGKTNGFLEQSYQDYSLLLKTLISDLAVDLLQKNVSMARKKISFLIDHVPSFKFSLLHLFLSVMMKFGKIGGFFIQKAIQISVTLSGFLPPKKL